RRRRHGARLARGSRRDPAVVGQRVSVEPGEARAHARTRPRRAGGGRAGPGGGGATRGSHSLRAPRRRAGSRRGAPAARGQAPQKDVRKSVADPIHDAPVNILGTIALLQSCTRRGTRKVIYASTGGALYGEGRSLPATEQHPVNPESPYGASKHTVEHYLHLWKPLHGLDWTVLRYPNVYGPRQSPHGEAGVNAIFIGL